MKGIKMSGILDAFQWMSEHMDDKGDRTPLPSGHPAKPDYMIAAESKEAEAWKASCKVIEEELESRKEHPDYERLEQAHIDWESANDELINAYKRWRKEQKEQK